MKSNPLSPTASDEHKIDWTIFWTTLILLGIGMVMVFSSTFYLGFSLSKDALVFLRSHMIRLGLGIIALIIGMKLNYSAWRKLAGVGLVASLVLLIVTLIIGKFVYGARRWIGFLDFAFQPSEFCKIALIFYLARFFSDRQELRDLPKKFVLPALLVTGTLILLIAAQPNIGTAISVTLIAATIFFLAGVKFRHLLGIGVLAGATFAFLIATFPHARARVASFISHKPYQVEQSIIGIGSGGLFGQGLGESKQKFRFLPLPHTDFIYSILAEETGFIGSLIIFILFIILLLRSTAAARDAPDDFSFLASSGLVAMIFLYFLLHCGVGLGVLPATGLPLPFISFGGSALVSNLFAVGIILNVSKHSSPRRPDEDYVARRWNGRAYLPSNRLG
jgi:cell division protein FtsW